ncbi:patatin-like phospholipase family protein [Piscinibacter gummiphilus]|uniref:Patatin-like phospholipase family protein n=1 Tax=Piscinibacter gummiphilus TaxID=946333 RepID=A0ABZ0CUV3_9BURK|nr:patatin-like phospholipase family protein [Piscinibacter gummiphilus]WOB08748.1 patatin-like phospholipase family protein [Piscinibacter gummiphilus]
MQPQTPSSPSSHPLNGHAVAAAYPRAGVPVQPPKRRPRVALVLGSGGVRSIAAVGIVERLRHEGIWPDLVVGCSSGALFGATIAMEMSPKDALHAATTLWSAELTQQPRWRAYPQMVAPKLMGFDADFGLRDNSLIALRLEAAFGGRKIESLPTQLRVAATDATTGKPVVLAEGLLTQALLASMAVPFIFPSVEVDGRRLVDGVVSDPLPLDAARDAEVILALGFEGAMPRRVDRASRLVAQATTSLINNLMQARLEAAVARGQRIVSIELGLERKVGLWETGALPYLYEAGRRAATHHLPRILDQLEGRAQREVA